MLVLSRRPNESVIIGENIKVTVVRVRGNVVSLGIEAPRSVRIMREEIMNRQPANDEIEIFASEADVEPAESDSEVETPLLDLNERLYSPEEFADRCKFSNPLAAYMFSP